MKMPRATCKLQATIEIDVPSSNYGPEWKVGDLHKQAAQEGEAALRDLLGKSGLRAKIVGAVQISIITFDVER